MLLASASQSHGIQISYRMENTRRNRIYGKPDKNARVDTGELADEVSAPTPLIVPLINSIEGSGFPLCSMTKHYVTNPEMELCISVMKFMSFFHGKDLKRRQMEIIVMPHNLLSFHIK